MGKIKSIKNIRVGMLVTDAYDGIGGIAKFNRDFISALTQLQEVEEVIVLPRLGYGRSDQIPLKVNFIRESIGGKLQYLKEVLAHMHELRRCDVIICGHINLLPLAYMVSIVSDIPLVQIIHGYEAWSPNTSILVNVVARRLRNFISVSKVTRNCFIDWTGIKKDCGFILPNSVNLTAFQPGPKSRKMLEQYGLTEAVVLMTVGRLDSKERYKGFDEVLELIPRLRKNIPNIKYLIVGDGPDRKRLEEKVRNLNITQEVIFTGYISEKLKADYYRLSDVFVMPSRKEGFGIVFLEAMACGIPVIGSISDGSSEALLDGKLGELVDPKDKKEIERTIYRVLRQHKKSISRVDLETFSKDNFDNRVEKIMHSVLLDKNYSGVII